MSVLLIAEHNNKELRPFTLNAATAASQIDKDVHAVIIGHECVLGTKDLADAPIVGGVTAHAPHIAAAFSEPLPVTFATLDHTVAP